MMKQVDRDFILIFSTILRHFVIIINYWNCFFFLINDNVYIMNDRGKLKKNGFSKFKSTLNKGNEILKIDPEMSKFLSI